MEPNQTQPPVNNVPEPPQNPVTPVNPVDSPLRPLETPAPTTPVSTPQIEPAIPAAPNPVEPVIQAAPPQASQPSVQPVVNPAPAQLPGVAPTVQAPMQQSTDPSQPGYIPPAIPNTPMANAMPSGKSRGSSKKIRIIAIVIFCLFALSGLGVLAKDTLFTGSKIKVSDLQEETAGYTTFKHPKQWTKVTEQEADAAYSEGGKKLDDSDQGMAVASKSLGGNYDSLSQDQKDQVYKVFEKQFSDKANLGSDTGCQDVSEPKITKKEQPNFTSAIEVEFSCGKYSGRNVKGEYKMVVGFKGERIHVLAIGAIDKTWNKSGEALDDILNTFKPAPAQ